MCPHPYTKPRLIRLSRALAHALRHMPRCRHLGGNEHEQDWVSVSDVLDILRKEKAWRTITRTDLEEMIAKSARMRYEIRGDKIRALTNHSTSGKLKTPARPPDILYHGADEAHTHRIRVEGLVPSSYPYVCLSGSPEEAFEAGRRQTPDPIIMKIAAKRASDCGVQFYVENDKVWLTDAVPPEFISWE